MNHPARARVAALSFVALLPFVSTIRAEETPAAPPPGGSILPKTGAPDPRPFTLVDRYVDAAQRGDLAMVKLCLEKGVDLHAKDSVGRSALLLAVRDGRNLELAKFLHEKGLEVDEADAVGRTALGDAAGNGDVAIVSWLLEQGASLARKDAQGQNPLFSAVLGGSRETVQKLIDAGADLNARNNFFDTPLMAACSKGNDEIARLLVEKGADPSMRDQEGRTARQRSREGAAYCLALGDQKPAAPAH